MIPGLLIAAPKSGSGKTTVTLGLLRALVRRGVRVSGAKNGPDYIDPAFHAAATGRPSFNLDTFAMPADLLDALGARAGEGADLVIAEGSMGLFDGVAGAQGATGASADLAARFGWPVVLVLDVSGHAQSAAATALGAALFDPRIDLAGVILNRVASARHERLVRDGMERTGIPVLGAIPRSDAIVLPERHLGLVQASETSDLTARLDALADLVERTCDVAAIIASAGQHRGVAGERSPPSATGASGGEGGSSPSRSFLTLLPSPPGRRVALARDAEFTFTYPHVLGAWRDAGVEVVVFSPLADEAVPEGCDAVWLPGGYPELHAPKLAAAARFKASIAAFASTRPVHGECGGYMVLGETLISADGNAHPMLGLLPVSTSFAKRKMTLGYRQVRTLAATALGPAGLRLTGHEFHYATTASSSDDGPLATAVDGEGKDIGAVGHVRGRVSGSFFHVIARVG